MPDTRVLGMGLVVVFVFSVDEIRVDFMNSEDKNLM